MSYFPCDIPYMSKEELEANGIKIPHDKKQEQPDIIRCGHCEYYKAMSNHWGQCRVHNNQTCQIIGDNVVCTIIKHAKYVTIALGQKGETNGTYICYVLVE